ncbi:hypothetical protein TL16_g05011 [Triparma laevis f. inornata]|uniref:WW domain-containing protein n=1 Tax=Triparma laevis f. inornata TaxID=1714386 RepID=A0A9W7E800_9STRA|nr:hypothetical protein TL16_g05011 [Triparma laevis f. inornata]
MGWESAQDANGKTYYFNRGTGETSWKKPAEMEVEIQPSKKEKRSSNKDEKRGSGRSSSSKRDSKRQSSRQSKRQSQRESDLSAMYSSQNSGVRASNMSELSAGASAMSRQFFPEHKNCKCCKGFIYGCNDPNCTSLGHCVCTTMKDGRALGATKKRAGKYEVIRSPEQLPHPESWPLLWLSHVRRCYFGSFMDKRLASHHERKYLGNQLKMDPHESSEAFSLLAWRKSVLYVLFILSIIIVGMDVMAVRKEFDYWGYLGEMQRAPTYHGISSMPPYNIPDDYMSEDARLKYRLPSPSSWTTLTGHIRDKNSGLCLGSASVFTDLEATIGSKLSLRRCSADEDVQWLYGSDLGSYEYARQLKLNDVVSYASVDPFTQAPTVSPTPGPAWRTDYKCGPVSIFAGVDDTVTGEVPCNGEDPSFKCCNRNIGRCGATENFCGGGSSDCDSATCCDYSQMTALQTTNPTCYNAPGISLESLSSPIGICMNAYKGYQLNIDLCTSNAMQGFIFDEEGVMKSEQWNTCVVVKKNGQYTSAINAELFLRPCDDDEYVPIKWEIPDDKTMPISALEPVTQTNVDLLSSGEPCSFLSQPKSANWWPVYAYQDTHKECLKFNQTSTDTGYESKVRYEIPPGFSRFQAHVGMGDVGEIPVGEIRFEVNLCSTENNCRSTTEIICRAETLDYGTQENFTTTVTRNLCKFEDCQATDLEGLINSNSDKLCWQSYQPMDVVVADQQYIELIVRSPRSCRPQTFTDADGVETEILVNCDGRSYASWGSPTFTNAVRAGEEGMIEYTGRMLWGMHAAIFEPCWVIFIAMDTAILVIDFVCMILIFWALWYWAAYKRSRGKLFSAWSLTFVGPLLISCIPVRLFIPWDRSEGHIAAYLTDLEGRYNLATAEDMVLETCKTFTAGYGDTGLDSLVGTATTLCAKKETVPASCTITDVNNYATDHECYNYYDIGGAMQWADHVNLPDVNNMQYADFIYTSPINQRIEGFPSTCFDIFGDHVFSDVCYDTSSGMFPDWKNTEIEADNPMPCKGLIETEEGFDCDLGGSQACELSGYCRMPSHNGGTSTVACSNLYKQMNCTDIATYYSSYCDCTCSAKLDSSIFDGSDDEPSVSDGIPDWYYDNEWCLNGMIETAVPKIDQGMKWIPFKGNVFVNTYPMHVDCGKIRGFLFEGKFEKAVEAVKVMCDGLVEDYDSAELSMMDRVMEGVETLLDYATQMAGISASVYNAFTMFRLALPVALCIGPALLRGALRTKLLVPQSATPGLFIQLLPWLYCPIVWCLFNFIFQLIGNVWLLPGLLLLAYIPMTYFIVGVRQELSKPMTKQAINLVIFWLDIFALFASIIAYSLLAYGCYYTVYLDPNSQMLSLLITDVIIQEDGGIPWPIVIIAVVTLTKVLFKYTATTVTGVDFMMYELIQQRFYEMFLEKGDATAEKLQEARANRLDAFCKLVAQSTSSQMSRSQTKNSTGKRGSTMGKRGSTMGKMSFSRSSSAGTHDSGSHNSRSSKHRGSTRGHSDTMDMTRESSFASNVHDDKSHLVGSASIKQVIKKQASVWDLINNGQPRMGKLPANTINAMFCTPLHLRRSRSKLEILKKMASRAEVAYLSKKLGLTHTADSAICYELMVWRRSALWTLILFGSLATFFAITAINTDALNTEAYYDLAKNGVLHRFPMPGYLQPYTREHFGLDDPGDWTVFSGPIKTNITDPSVEGDEQEMRYFSLSGTDTQGVGIELGLVTTYDYSKRFQQWSLEPVNGTLRNEDNMCVGTESGLGSALVTKGCINDFLREKADQNLDLVWEAVPARKWGGGSGYALKNGNGLCMGFYSAEIPKFHDPEDDGDGNTIVPCGAKNPLANGDPAQCDGGNSNFKCCNSKQKGDYHWDGSSFTDIASTCGGTEEYCRCETCLDYSGSADTPALNRPEGFDENPKFPLTSIPIRATTCGSQNMISVELPDRTNVVERLDSWCNDPNYCHWSNETDITMYAMFDYGVNYESGDSDIRWRCYADHTTRILNDGTRVYDTATAGRKYCDVHNSITALLERAQGREEFNTYMKRMVKVGYARMMAEAEAAMVSINALLILLAWAAIVLAYLGFHFYSRYKLSRSLVMMGWFCTFLAPFLLSMIPLRLFIQWDRSQPVQDAMLMEFRDHYDLNSKETAILDTCATLEDDGSVDSLVSMTLDMCAYTKKVPQDTAHRWGDTKMTDGEDASYVCTDDYLDSINGQSGAGYPAVPKNPCEAILAGNGQAWVDQGTYVCNSQTDCNCPPEDTNCAAVEEQSGTDMSLDEWYEKCMNAPDTIPSLYYDGYVAWFFMGSDGEPIQVDTELYWPASIWVSQVSFDVNELLVECGQARRYICMGDVYKAMNSAKAVCAEIRAWMDDDVGTDAENIEQVMELLMKSVKETSEVGISLIHSVKSFKIMSSATFALAPALIRAAIRVKTAVPQNSISGMFVIVLPWLYSPLVWCVYNLVFQVIGNWQLLVGLIIMAYGPVLFFAIGIWKDITRPMPDKEIHIIRLMMTIVGRLKIFFGAIFVFWGLWAYAFEEQAKYTSEYKSYLMKDFSTMAMLELGASIVMKYYYTTIVGVDYMLSQILSSRRYEVYMQMASQNSMWANSKAAKRAAELKEHYVSLMNKFCHMAGLSTADLPAFAHYRAHKIRKKKREKARAMKKEKSLRMGKSKKSTGLAGLFGEIFSRPPDRSEGVPDIQTDIHTIVEDEEDNEGGVEMGETRNGRGASEFAGVNPMAVEMAKQEKKEEKEKKKKKKKKEEDASEWQYATDPQSGKKYKYNSRTGETQWIDEGEDEANIGKANGMSDDELLEMLRKSPKEVTELHSRDAFRKFFNGFPKERIEGLLREANAGKEEADIKKKVGKRMKLLDGVLT